MVDDITCNLIGKSITCIDHTLIKIIISDVQSGSYIFCKLLSHSHPNKYCYLSVVHRNTYNIVRIYTQMVVVEPIRESIKLPD